MVTEISPIVRHPFDYAFRIGLRSVGENPDKIERSLAKHPGTVRIIANILSIVRPIGGGMAINMYEKAEQLGNKKGLVFGRRNKRSLL